MAAWGPRGRLLYVAIEAIDWVLYMPAYRGAFLVICNWTMGALKHKFPGLRPLGLLPVVLVLLDRCEDSAQLLLVAVSTAPQLPGFWNTLVRLSSAINMIKWSFVVVSSSTLLVLLILAAYETTLGKERNGAKHKKA